MASITAFNYSNFISVRRAARLLNCSDQTIYRYLEAGELAGFRRSARGYWLIRKDSIQRKFHDFHTDFPDER